MQFTTTKEVTDAFLLLFASLNPLTLSAGDRSFTVRVTYAKKSANDYTESDPQQTYPVIAIYDFPPKEAEGFKSNGQAHTGNLRDTNGDGKLDMGTLYKEPIYYEFRFDVSIAAKSYHEFWALYDFMQKTFVTPDGIMLTNNIIEGEDVGAAITLTTDETDIPRTDGVMETNFEMSFKRMVAIKPPVDMDLASDLHIIAKPIKP